MKARKPPKPTIYQTKILAQIARSPLMKTYGEDRKTIWSLQNGQVIPVHCVEVLIRNGWVKGVRDGLGMFDESQTYVALRPQGAVAAE